MDAELLIAQLERNSRRIAALAADVPEEQARWKPEEQSWSILEVVNHLYDEEREDFRVRLNLILYHPGQPWPPIDPRGWVTARQYGQRLLGESLVGFLAERQDSLDWLRGLQSPDWTTAEQAPWGQVAAGDMLAAWAAHDVLHLRQLVELHHFYLEGLAQPYATAYAGDW